MSYEEKCEALGLRPWWERSEVLVAGAALAAGVDPEVVRGEVADA